MFDNIFNVLSLFDGMSCGQIALNRAGVRYDQYFASEVDRHAITVTQANYPRTRQLGDVTRLSGKQLPMVSLLMGGSPCQGFSSAGKGLNFDDPRSKLFFEFVRLKNETNPKYFLLENVKMKQEWQDIISEFLGVKPIYINSADFSAQNRQRLYWTNIPIDHWESSIDSVADLLETGDHLKNFKLNRTPSRIKMWADGNGTGGSYSCVNLSVRNKSNALTTKQDRFSNAGLIAFDGFARYLTPTECERLQTVPDEYTKSVSRDERYKMLGNGWTVDVIAHIFRHIAREQRMRLAA